MKRESCYGCPALNGDGTCTVKISGYTITITPDMEQGCSFAPDDPAKTEDTHKPARLIDADALIEALDEYGMMPLQSDFMPGNERVYNIVRQAPTIDAVPRDYHERCLEIMDRKRAKAEKKQKLTEATNRKIIENYLPVVRCTECEYWTKQADSIQGRCALLAIYPTASWFCANGTMRTDND